MKDTAHIILLLVIVCEIEVYSTPHSGELFTLSSGHKRDDVWPVSHTFEFRPASHTFGQALPE